MSLQLVAIQMSSGPDPQENLMEVEASLAQLKIDGPTLVVLPECFACFGAGDKRQRQIAETQGNGVIQDALARLAAQFGVWLVAGSMPIVAEPQQKRFSATAIVYNPQGQTICAYQKIHLFDVEVDDNTGSYRESDSTQPGHQVVTFDSPFGRVGVAICYDLRFAGLFDAMGQIDVLVLPAAFTQKTGQAHWHALISARAIEKQCYLVAANQWGEHRNGRQTYGHSQIVDPWGQILAEKAVNTGTVTATMDPQQIIKIRKQMPVQLHNKFRSHFVTG